MSDKIDGQSSEDRLLDWIRQSTPPLPDEIPIGPGDDAALVEPRDGDRLLLSIDTLVEEVDFSLKSASPEQIGCKAMGVSLSDMAAMGASPWVALASATIPHSTAETFARNIVVGLRTMAARHDTLIVGGDLSATPGPLTVSVVVVGRCPTGSILTRSGGRPGDLLFVTGALGGSILGRHLSFEPRIKTGRLLSKIPATAAIDLSDGLLKDLDRLARASGCGAELESSCIPIHPDARHLSQQTECSPLEHALSDGEDFELLFSLSPTAAEAFCEPPSQPDPFPANITQIGRLVTGSGISLVSSDGQREVVGPRGYGHEWGTSS